MSFASKAMAVCLALCLMLPAGLTFVSAAEAEDTLIPELISRSEAVTDMLTGLSEEDIERFKDSTDAVTVSLVEAWESSAEELGAYVEPLGEPTVEKKNNDYTVTIPRQFEKAKAEFVYIYDRKMNPQSSSINVKLPMGLTLARALANTIMGIMIVFLMLAFLSFIISRLQYVPGLVDNITGKVKGKVTKDTAVPAKGPAVSAPAPQAAAVLPPQDLMDDSELVAVITAAVAAYEQDMGQAGENGFALPAEGFAARTIRKANRRR